MKALPWIARPKAEQEPSPLRCCYVLVGEFEQNACRCFRVYECNSAARRTLPRHLVHQAVSRFSAGLDRGIQVGYPIANVVNAGPAPGKKPRDWTVRLGRRQQLHLRVTEGNRDDGCSVRLLGRMWLELENVSIEGERRFYVGHGNADVGYARAISQESSEL